MPAADIVAVGDAAIYIYIYIYIRFMHKPDHTKHSRSKHNLHKCNLLYKYMAENIISIHYVFYFK